MAQYEARQDVVLTASVRLFQAELTLKLGQFTAADAQFREVNALRKTIKRPFTSREQSRYSEFGVELQPPSNGM